MTNYVDYVIMNKEFIVHVLYYVCNMYWVLICTVLMFHVSCLYSIDICYQLSTVIFYAGDKQENQCL